MTQPAVLLILPTSRNPDEETDAIQTTQSLEDLRLAERIERAFHATGYSVLRDIEVFVNARIGRLVGQVPSYHMKQIAQVTALAVPGTHQIQNDLEVIPLTDRHKEVCDLQPRQRKFVDPPDKKIKRATPEPMAEQVGAKPGVLVVDDEHMVRVMVQLGLERNGFEVLLASNGLEAIDLFQAHREEISAVLLDACMPSLDGVQTLDNLRELDCGVPACFMSADNGADELLQRGAANVIAKPFQLEELVSILSRLTGRATAEFLSSGSACQK